MTNKILLGTITTSEGKEFPVYSLSRGEAMATFRPYGSALGLLAFSWNTLHEALSRIFKSVVGAKNNKIASAIWFSSDSDFSQRKMLREAIQVTDHLPEKQREDILWLLNKIDESLRHKRNDVIHVPVSITRGVINDKIRRWVIANKQSDNPRAKKMISNGSDLKTAFSDAVKFSEALSTFAVNIDMSLTTAGKHPWPGKPKMPHAHQKKSRKGLSHRKTAK